uniref:Uncharacterized protein n=1 Tax=Helicotheca tamesis TaxID=374047 RepID=A0A7S2I332_9STRA|mmetsp:Transcript_5197/g.7126  ORF Transcript_5197/g.7126 Transcript_5197/m.7126 type:complete len:667 (+) Transcript_5197:150-2150(+)
MKDLYNSRNSAAGSAIAVAVFLSVLSTAASFVPAARKLCLNKNHNQQLNVLDKTAFSRVPDSVGGGWMGAVSASRSGRQIRMEGGSKSTRLHLTYDDDEDDEDEGLYDGSIGDDLEEDEDEYIGGGSGIVLDDKIDAISWLPSVHKFLDNASPKASTRGSSNRRRIDISSNKAKKNKANNPTKITSIRKDAKVMPLLAISSKEIHIPHSEHSLSIGSPRYVELFEHVLDSKRLDGEPEFAVTICHPTKDGVFAQYGVIFRVLDFMEVDGNDSLGDNADENMDVIVDFALSDLGSGDNDMIEDDGDLLDGMANGGRSSSSKAKYIAHHEVVGIVKIHQVLNPEDWKKKDTYLRVEATVVDDIVPSSSSSKGVGGQSKVASISLGESFLGGPLGSSPSSRDDESSSSPVDDILTLHENFSELVTLQHKLNEDVKFSKSSVDTFSQGVILASSATDKSASSQGFWITIMSWQQYTEQRILARHAELLSDFQDHLMDYLGPDAPESIDIADLPIYLREEATEVERRVKRELGPLRMELGLSLQTLLEARDHEGRIKILNSLIKAELQRLRTKKSMRAIFGSDDSTTISSSWEGNVDDEEEPIDNFDDVPMSIMERKITEEARLVEQMRDRLTLQFGGANSRGDEVERRAEEVERPSQHSVFYDDMGDAFQ